MKKILFSLMKHTFKFENIIEFIFKINKKILNLYQEITKMIYNFIILLLFIYINK